MTRFTAPISEQIWDMKYRLKDNDGNAIDKEVEDTWGRIADALALAEGDNVRSEHRDQFYAALENFQYLPAGRITAGAGTGRMVTLFNCFVMGTVPNSMGGIFSMLREAALTMQQGGGIGYDFSTIRPRGASVTGVAADASGPLSFMDVWDAMCRTIMSAGSRRGAMMATMSCDHPDIEDFITAKQDAARLRMFNLSVLVTDPFMEAVKADGDWPLVHVKPPAGVPEPTIHDHEGRTAGGGMGLPRYVHRVVKARELWNTIIRSTYDYAEPGVIFIDRINDQNNLRYVETIAATNPCVSGDTAILTKTGYSRIDGLLGDSVEVWNGEQWSLVTPRVTGRNQPMVRVELSDGSELRCTEAHRFYLSSGECVPAMELAEGDSLLKSKWPITEPDYADQPGLDYYGQGFYSGDGWLKTETQGQYIGLYGVKKDLPHEWNSVSRKTYEIAGGYEGTDNTETKDYLYFGKDWFNAKTFVPEGHSIEARRAWLAGLVDSDGYVTKNSCIQITSKDRGFLKRVKMLLNTMGATGQLSPMKDCFRLSISGSDANALELPLLRFAVQPIGASKSRFVKVLSVEPDGREDTVYCFTEPKRGLGVFAGVLTGQCGEQPLPPYGACLLGSINLARLIDNPFADNAGLDSRRLKKLVHTAVRMMDNVVDVSNFPLPQQKEEAENKRRIGLGVTGVADALMMVRLRYGTEAAAERLDKWMRLIDVEAYRASVELAKEKGAFPLFDADKFLADGTHASTMPDDVQAAIRKHGIRNALLTSIAPTGTISLYAGNVSSGIEPVFALAYKRKVLQKDGTRTEEEVVDYAVQLWRELRGDEPLPDYFVTAQELKPHEHVIMQAAAQRHVDSSISKTINCPEDISFEDFKAVYDQAYDTGCKGCTTYRPNDVTGSVLSVDPPKEEKPDLDELIEAAREYEMSPEEIEAQAASFAKANLELDRDEGDLIQRPEALTGTTYKIKVGSNKAVYLTVSDITENGVTRPFEIFLRSSDPTHDEWMVGIARTVSAVMRRGEARFIAEDFKRIHSSSTGGFWGKRGYQPSTLAAIGTKLLEHMNAGGITQPVKALRVDPSLAEMPVPEMMVEVKGKPCPSCGSYNFKRESGCSSCVDCGWSSCG